MLDLDTDVLVIGGGMAGAWAALSASRSGRRVVLVDKGYCGTSGVTATGGPGHWWVPPDKREPVVAQRARAGLGLADPRWMHRILDTTWRELPGIAPHYRFGVNAEGRTVYRALRGPEYMRALRSLVDLAGVTVLDHHPALELLRADDGSVAGAAGLRRRDGARWTIRSGAVVLASGGCAFLSKLLGADHNTGDGLLMGAEVGAELSGMEFTDAYTVAPVFSSMTRAMSYVFARYYDAAGRELDIPPGPANHREIARALLQGPVYCCLQDMPDDLRAVLPSISPNVMLPFTRRGIDPFRDHFEIQLRGEGTVRSIGGLRVASDDCETAARNLFVAGDVASRERVTGAISGGGNINSAWALSSGVWAGAAAAQRALLAPVQRTRSVAGAGQAGLRPPRPARELPVQPFVQRLQRPTLGLDLNIFREGPALNRSLAALDQDWSVWRDHAGDRGEHTLRHREVAALLASARWNVSAALARRESRGMHLRTDAPHTDPALARSVTQHGIDRITTVFADQPPAPSPALTATA
ncbi:FAD-dependent oxidoreductase [Hydrogenophaga sp. MI9]|uniref:FAD-dependent oxidoreductase n=1 Tax=Hydrogenophaga sp. MI9 TaxID=3453719 RepID=UPI003EEB1709